MPYDEELAGRVRSALGRRRGISEKKMFGGLSFLLRGNMCCGVAGDELIVRVGPDRYEKAIERAHARQMDFTGKPLRGFVYVAPEGFDTDRKLASWIDEGVAFAKSLPAK